MYTRMYVQEEAQGKATFPANVLKLCGFKYSNNDIRKHACVILLLNQPAVEMSTFMERTVITGLSPSLQCKLISLTR